MKTVLRIAALLVLFFAGITSVQSVAPLLKTERLAYADNVSVSAAAGAFYNTLLPYGEWVWTQRCGWVWSPYNVPVDWRPYTRGRWVMSDYGWTWASSEPWGWACFHYGRWFDDDTYGWVWCPGTVWAPAWVCWRYSDDWIGWAPLPPEVGWNDEFGLDLGGIDFDVIIPVFAFSFCEERYFLDDDLDWDICLPARNVTIIRNTRIFCDFGRENNRIVNHLPVEGRLGRLMGHRVPHYRIADADSPTSAQFKGNQVNVFRPNLRTAAENSGRARLGPETGKIIVPQELNQRQQEEQRNLQEQQNVDRQSLQKQHRSEMQSLPPDIPQEEINQRHQTENNALEKQMNHENQLLNNWHAREQIINSAPSSSRERKYKFSGPPNVAPDRGKSDNGGDGNRGRGSSPGGRD